jgi:hypothetical protein
MAMLTILYPFNLTLLQKLSSKLADQSFKNRRNQPFTVRNTVAAYTQALLQAENID